MSLTNVYNFILSLLWVNTPLKNCFGSVISHDPFEVNRVFKSFSKSILNDWYTHILLDGYGKVVHTFTLGERWFMVNVNFDPESLRYKVHTKVSGMKLSEEEERLLDFFEWYLSATLTVTHDVDREGGYVNRIDIFQKRNENWCTQKNNFILS